MGGTQRQSGRNRPRPLGALRPFSASRTPSASRPAPVSRHRPRDVTMPTPLSQRLRHETATLHRQAERSGIMLGLLRGRLDRGDYVLLLRALHEVYTALESRLDATASFPDVRPFYDRRLHRVASRAADLSLLHGVGWEDEVAAGNAAREYADRILCATPLQLVAHAYVRYLGDLSGGQALGQVVARALALPNGDGTAFYRFPEIADAEQYKDRFRAALDAWPVSTTEADGVVREAQEAFRLNVRVFEGVATRTAPSDAPPLPPGA